MKRLFHDRISVICILLGVALILGAAGVAIASRVKDSRAKVDADRLLQKVQAMMPPAVNCVPEERGNNTMASMQIDGVNVVGVLEFPQYGRSLPVVSEWDTARVSSVPSRFTGSIYDSSLIIGAVDSQNQIPFAGSLEVGTEVVLTDMEGGRYTYRVSAIHHAKHATLEKLQEGDYDLTIFVKDSENAQYLLIRCNTKATGS